MIGTSIHHRAILAVYLFLTSGIAMPDSDNRAGIVILATGDVYAVSADAQKRPLSRRSPFFNGDVLHTGDGASAQIRFLDGAVVSLRAATALMVDEFRFTDSGDDDRNFTTLLKGGLRTITGTIGKEDPTKYRVTTPVATIGVRGTHYEAVYENELSVAAWQGSVSITNKAGQLVVGADGQYNFARVSGLDQRPIGTIKPPAILRPATASDQPDTAARSRRTEDAQPASDAQSPAEKPVPNELAQDRRVPTHAAKGSMQFPPTGDAQETHVGPAVPTANNLARPAWDIVVPTTLAGVLRPEPNQIQPFNPTSTTLGCLCLTQAEASSIDRVGLAVISGPGPKALFTGGRASNGNTGSPILTDNGLDPENPDFFVLPPLAILRQGNAALGSAFPVTHGVYPVSWGMWNGTAAAPVRLQDNPNDPTLIKSIASPVFWLTGIPASPLQLGISGVKVWGSPQMFMGSSDSGAITNFFAFAAVNLDSGNLFGRMNLVTAGNSDWDISYSGVVRGSVLDINNTIGTRNGTDPVSGKLAAFFLGPNANAIAGSFNLTATADPALHAEGLFLLDDSPDQRLTTAERSTLDRSGIAIISGPGITFDVSGHASDGSGGAPIFTDNGYAPHQGTQYAVGTPREVLKRGSATILPSPATVNINGNTAYPVSWGAWDGLTSAGISLEVYKDPNSTTPSNVNQFAFWTTFVPTPSTVLAGRSGVLSYNNVVGIIGNGTDGQVTGASAVALNVNFDTGMVNGNLNVNAGSFAWLMNVNGEVIGPTVKFSNVAGDYTGTAAANDAIGKMRGVITGPTGQAVAGGFDLQTTGGGAGVEGVFVVQCANPSTC